MKLSWPRGFPHPISCLRVFALALSYSLVSSGLAQVIPVIGPGVFIWSIGVWLGSSALMAAYHYCLTSVLLWVKSWYRQSFIGYQELQNRTAHIQKPRDTWKEGIAALVISPLAVATGIIFFVFVLYHSAPAEIDPTTKGEAIAFKALEALTILLSAVFTSAKLNQPLSEVLPEEWEAISNIWVILFVVWFVVALLLYQLLHQFSLWVRRRRAAKERAKKPATKSTQATKIAKLEPIDPIERELNGLKADNGLNPMNSVRGIAEWYVFRSGKAEGPYTKQQLQSVQKMTARTSVRRRGQDTWEKAGNIPELKPFLSESLP